ncbi:Putative signal transduction response regulator, receiver domain, histidine kinase/HSP90-like ATPase [Septoria linicola]|uniref:histidine kinase n=1 Tax=Septoria linicola TaxID=215465 RepID=A0A9Q9AYG5_9PEZI|nr:Putative signal transduction response regulator, receiver domain, histidine kinase/HSP90-like ATPase [Septoria linicola]
MQRQSAQTQQHTQHAPSQAERECHQYYEAWLAAHGSPGAVSQYLSSLADPDPGQRQGFESLSSRDRTLIAFAQNVVFRLNVRRCMISLIDSAHQYVLGEATHSHSSVQPQGAAGDEIWLGSAVLARPDAMCWNCLDTQCEARDSMAAGASASASASASTSASASASASPPGAPATLSANGMIINDCRADPRFASRPYVMQDTGARVRFYAGVPLVTRNGYKIGVLAATDEHPRNGLLVDELRYMQDMAQCAVDHLEWARDRVDRFKGERIVRGMATFIDESASAHSSTTTIPIVSQPTQPAVNPHRSRDDVSAIKQSPERPRRDSWRRVAQRNAQRSRDDAEDVLALAAQMLQQSTLADGCLILGSNVQSQTPDGNDPRAKSSSPRLSKVVASCLGEQHDHRIPRGQVQSTLKVDTLYAYSRRFPRGCILSRDDEHIVISTDGECSSHDEVPTIDPAVAHREGRLRTPEEDLDHHELLQQVPGARTVIFMPLFDSLRAKLIAGLVLWSCTPGRMVDVYISHVRAFASCITSELERVDMQRDEAAKTTFIASMSHELRTPLHGILGAADFLLDATTSAYDTGLVQSIITCGKTLLETLNHVLDHSKINKLGNKGEEPMSSEPADNAFMDSMNLVGDVDLSVLVEEAAEVMAVGHTFRKVKPQTTNSSLLKSFDSLTSSLESGQSGSGSGVTVLLDVTARHDWRVTTQPGAISRIVMNLLGNAFKYTSEGFIALSLRAFGDVHNDQVSVLIRVVDSGRGMSENFLQERLFVPFSQEDSFQPGVGLGFSIVKQLVDMLGGSINVQSAPHRGTQVDVYLKLAAAPGIISRERAPTSIERPSDICRYPLAVTTRTAGKKVVLLDPLDPERVRTSTHQASRFQHTLSKTCEEWFGMQVVRETQMDADDDVSIYIYGEPPPIEMLRNHKRPDASRKVPVILACQNDRDAISVLRDQQKFLLELGQIVEVIQQPCGPQKLARAFSYCFSREEELNHTLHEKQRSVGDDDDQQQRRPRSRIAVDGAYQPHPPLNRASSRKVRQELRKSVSAATALELDPPLSPTDLDPRSSGPHGDTSLDLFRDDSHKTSPSDQKLRGAITSESKDGSMAGSLHILAVDDNKLNRQLLIRFIKKCGFTFEQAENGQEALDMFTASCSSGTRVGNSATEHEATSTAAQSSSSSTTQIPVLGSAETGSADTNDRAIQPFDYILMDISMPVMDGMEATRRIRQLEESLNKTNEERIKVFALTGLASQEAQADAEAAGFDLFLMKPVKFADLKKLLVQR